MKVAMVEEMRQIDKLAGEKYGIPEAILMENAGRAVAGVVVDELAGVAGKTICVLAGAGNNGGDAFVAARHLANHGAQVKVFLVGDTDKLTKSAAQNRDICQKMGITVQTLAAERDWEKFALLLKLADVIVDGLLGTGVKGPLRNPFDKVIEMVNEAGRPVVAIDIPSGVDAGSGGVPTAAIKADVTVTFGLPKTGHFFCPGAANTGRLVVDDISLPQTLLTDRGILQEYFDDEYVRALLPSRPIDAHKGSCGRVLVVAGSNGMTGAAALASEAALRSGAGVVTLATAESLTNLFAMKLTEVMTRPLPEASPGILGHEALEPLKKMMEEFDTVLMGPGLGRDPATLNLIWQAARAVRKPLVLDADALYAFAGHAETFVQAGDPLVLTPHLGEMAMLLGLSVEALRANLVPCCRKAATDWNAILVVKSECTLVAYPDSRVFLTSKGNPGMATAGSGDVLAGTIAGLMKQMPAADAPQLGVYLHGSAGDIAAGEAAEGLMAGDILRHLPTARRQLMATGGQIV
ncbi:MAG: NAD(P)H-hydrate dehydratase [Schwartzia sp.]|nr:NAD(P)H-hydrate dehydratase [Schwartzia sp. (in: firmicutes)]